MTGIRPRPSGAGASRHSHIDRFVLLYRFPNGKTMLDQFLVG